MPKNADWLGASIGMAQYKGGKKLDLIVAFRLFGRTSPIHFALRGRKRKYIKLKTTAKLIEKRTSIAAVRAKLGQIGTFLTSVLSHCRLPLKDAICTYATKTEEYIFASSAHYGIIFYIGSKTGFQLSGYVGWKHISLSVNRNLKGHGNEIFYLVFIISEIMFLIDVEPLSQVFFLHNLVGKGVNLADLNTSVYKCYVDWT
jgi:hypothetical protein